MTGPGIYSYSTTPASNVNANTGINWDEGMPPASVNNSARQNMTDIRNAFNDLIWFRYGKGDLDYSPVYVAGTQFKIVGADVTTAYHVGRRVKVVGSGTGTIYGKISVTAFSTDTTVTCVFDSGSLSNETLTVYLSQAPVTGDPVHPNGVSWSATNDDATAGVIGEYISSGVIRGAGISYTSGNAANITSISLTPGDWDVSGVAAISPAGTITQFSGGAGTTSATLPSFGQNGLAALSQGISVTGDVTVEFSGRITLSATTTVYLIGNGTFSSTATAWGFIGARRAR